MRALHRRTRCLFLCQKTKGNKMVQDFQSPIGTNASNGTNRAYTANDIYNINTGNQTNSRDNEYKGFGYALNNLFRNGGLGLLGGGTMQDGETSGNVFSTPYSNGLLPFLADIFWGNMYQGNKATTTQETNPIYIHSNNPNYTNSFNPTNSNNPTNSIQSLTPYLQTMKG